MNNAYAQVEHMTMILEIAEVSECMPKYTYIENAITPVKHVILVVVIIIIIIAPIVGNVPLAVPKSTENASAQMGNTTMGSTKVVKVSAYVKFTYI